MRLRLLRPMFFVAVAMMVAAGGGRSIQGADQGPTQLSNPDFAAPAQAARVGRLPEGRNGAHGEGSFSLRELPRAATIAAPLAQVAWIWWQARPLPVLSFLSAKQPNRGPPDA